jgi:hypothetical protein
MTFPSVAAVNYSEEGAGTTTHDVLLPAGIAAGDRLMMWTALDGAPVISGMPAGWVQLKRFVQGVNVTGEVWEKVNADGTEIAFTYTTDVTEHSVNRTWRVAGSHLSSACEPSTLGYPNGFASNVDLPAVTPTWGSADTLWVVMVALNDGRTVSVFDEPSFTDNQFTDTSGGTGIGPVGIGLASRNATTNAVNPANPTMTFTAATGFAGTSFAIRPAALSTDKTRRVRVIRSAAVQNRASRW